MWKRIAIAVLACAPAGLAVTAAEAATLDGLTLSVEYLHPDTSSVYIGSSGPFTVGTGVDATINVEGVTDILLDFAANTLTVTLNTVLTMPTWNATTFNGLHVMLGSGGSFTGFSLVSSDIAPVTTSFDPDELFINWAGASYLNGNTLSFDIGYAAPAAVPLPAGLPLMAAGVGALAVLGRRRRAA